MKRCLSNRCFSNRCIRTAAFEQIVCSLVQVVFIFHLVASNLSTLLHTRDSSINNFIGAIILHSEHVQLHCTLQYSTTVLGPLSKAIWPITETVAKCLKIYLQARMSVFTERWIRLIYTAFQKKCKGAATKVHAALGRSSLQRNPLSNIQHKRILTQHFYWQ